MVVLLVLLLARPGRVRSRFRLAVEGRKRGPGGKVVDDRRGHARSSWRRRKAPWRFPAKKSPASLARLTAVRGGVRLTVLRSEKFARLKTLPAEHPGHDLIVRLEGKKELTIRLASAK